MTTTAAQFIDPKKLALNNNNNHHYQVVLDDQDQDEDDDVTYEDASNDEQNKNSLEEEEEESSFNSSSISSKAEQIKCSAVHTLERDMPEFDYSHLIAELRVKILNECQVNEGIYSQNDIIKCKQDDWYLSRFLLRQKLDVNLAFVMLKKAMRFNNESLTNSIKREDFPAEFYKVGGLFPYESDRKGNKMLYIRVKLHRKLPEIAAVLHAFLYHNIQSCDEAAGGKGISIVFDCSGGGLANADMDTLLYLVSTLVNYFPKGLSYLLVHELPWILKPFWHIAKAWVSEEHRQLIKFSNSRTIFEYIDKENLPDFMGGTCERDYRAVPDNCTTLEQATKLWGIEKSVAKRILLKFAEYLPSETIEEANEFWEEGTNKPSGENDSDQENRPKSGRTVVSSH